MNDYQAFPQNSCVETFKRQLEINLKNKLYVLRWELIMPLLLQICFFLSWERLHKVSFTRKKKKKKKNVIEAFNSTSKYLDDLLGIDNVH